jgi:hypothetical protein
MVVLGLFQGEICCVFRFTVFSGMFRYAYGMPILLNRCLCLDNIVRHMSQEGHIVHV